MSKDIPVIVYPSEAYIKPQARGTVLIIGSDLNPVGSVLCPLVTAISAGNSVIVVPSSKCANSTSTLKKFFELYLDERFYKVVEGDMSVVRTLSSLPFDMICCTGSRETAIQVSRTAADNLVPVHLEIESSSPIIIDSSADIKQAAMK